MPTSVFLPHKLIFAIIKATIYFDYISLVLITCFVLVTTMWYSPFPIVSVIAQRGPLG